MSHILVCSTGAPGHVNPMLTIASSLARRGDDVTFATASTFRGQVESRGLRFVPFHGHADWDYGTLNERFPQRGLTREGPERLTFDLKHIFGDAISDQHQTILNVMAKSPVDLILTDSFFLGTWPLLLKEPVNRPAVISVGITVMFVTSADRPPVGAPLGTGEDAGTYLPAHQQFQRAFRPVDDYLSELLVRLGTQPLPMFFFDAMHALPDRYLQLTGKSFEYPASDLPSHIRFVGPAPMPPPKNFKEPDWWPKLAAERPVVLVTQGTVANADLGELLEPTIKALADEDVMVVAAPVRGGVERLSIDVPANTFVAPFIPFENLLPKVSVFVTNAGYNGVSQALLNGVPMVVAGTSEEKSFTTARVAWSGAGIDLQTQRPTVEQIRAAVRTVLTKSTYRSNAQRMSQEFRGYQTIENIAAEIRLVTRAHEEKAAATLSVA